MADRWRIGFLTVAGQNWYDLSSEEEAIAAAKREAAPGWPAVEVMVWRDGSSEGFKTVRLISTARRTMRMGA